MIGYEAPPAASGVTLPIAETDVTGLTTDLATRLAGRGTNAARPAAGTAGRLYRTTDNPRGLWIDTGSVWETVGPLIVARTSDSTAKQNNTLASDDALLWTPPASSTWFFEALLIMSAASATMDTKFGWSLPAGATMTWAGLGTPTGGGWQVLGTSGTVLTSLTETSTPSYGGNSSVFTLQLQGLIVVAATSGAVALQWAQSTTEAANLVMKTGSMLRLTRQA